jgi:hypothetical protein
MMKPAAMMVAIHYYENLIPKGHLLSMEDEIQRRSIHYR